MKKTAMRLAGCLLASCLLLPLNACSSAEPVKIVLTTGFNKNEIFRLEDTSCTLPELMVYLTTEQNTYESVYGREIWETKSEGAGLEERLKDKVLAEISQIKAMTLLAARREIVLSPEEEELAVQAAGEYYESLNETERSAMGVTSQLIEGMYRDYALADKVYRQIISDINPEISDDEARNITVQHILIKTVTENADGTISAFRTRKRQNATAGPRRCWLRHRRERPSKHSLKNTVTIPRERYPSARANGKWPLKPPLLIWGRMKSAGLWRLRRGMRSSSASIPSTGRKRIGTS